MFNIFTIIGLVSGFILSLIGTVFIVDASLFGGRLIDFIFYKVEEENK